MLVTSNLPSRRLNDDREVRGCRTWYFKILSLISVPLRFGQLPYSRFNQAVDKVGFGGSRDLIDAYEHPAKCSTDQGLETCVSKKEGKGERQETVGSYSISH